MPKKELTPAQELKRERGRLRPVEGVARLFYNLNVNHERMYHCRFSFKGNEIKRALGNDLHIAKNKLEQIIYDLNQAKTIKPKVKKKLSQFKTEIEKIQDSNDPTIAELWKEYCVVDLPKLSEQEQKTKRSRYKKWISDKFGKTRLSNFKYPSIQEFINYIDDNKLLARKTQDNLLTDISAIFTYAQKAEYTDRQNPCKFVVIKPYDNHVKLNVDEQQVLNLFIEIINLEDQQKRCMYLMNFHGRRLAEVRRAEVEDIDSFMRSFEIPAHKNKIKKTQEFKMTNLLYTELKDYMENWDITSGCLFPNPNTGKPYVDIRRSFKTLKKKAGVPQSFRFQDFRHVIGTLGRRMCSLPLTDLRDTLGHMSVLTTEIYEDRITHIASDVVIKILDELGIEVS